VRGWRVVEDLNRSEQSENSTVIWKRVRVRSTAFIASSDINEFQLAQRTPT
jgi:hypothetical protein